jgi:hypothetical protein
MNKPLQEGIAALKAGDKAGARRLIGRAIQQNPDDERAWLWLSGAVETSQERRMCLRRVLELDPDNALAQRGLVALKEKASPPESQSSPPHKVSPLIEQSETPPAAGVPEGVSAPTPDWSAALAPASSITDMLDHSRSIDQLEPEKREALLQFVPLIAQDVTSGRVPPKEIIERLVTRGFPRNSAEQLVKEIVLQPLRAPVRYQKQLSKEDLKDEPSPWFSVLTDPRETMRRILYYEPKRHVILLAVLDGIVLSLTSVLNGFSLLVSMGNELTMETYATTQYDLSGLPVLMLTYLIIGSVSSIVGGPISGLLRLYVGGALLRMTGRWLGGKAFPGEVRAALAWGSVPRLWGAILLLIRLFVFGYAAYVNAFVGAISSSAMMILAMVFGLLESVVWVWALVVLLKCLGEAHFFSAWKALGAVLLGIGVIFVAGMLAGCLFYLLSMMLAMIFSTQ